MINTYIECECAAFDYLLLSKPHKLCYSCLLFFNEYIY